jgi:thioredoxin-dependent peroxiredoxin
MRTLVTLFAFATLGAVGAGAQATPAGQPAGTSPAMPPAVGQLAPDFTATAVDGSGAAPSAVKLSALRGKVVVLAFYPLDRSSGCTAELTKFRDDYKTLFGDGVVVLPISVDTIESHASWAHDMKFPFALVADPTQDIAKTYASTMAGRKFDARTVFVIGKDGKIQFSNMKFGALNEDAYKELAAAVAKAKS